VFAQVSGGTAGCAADSYALCRETVRARLDFYIVSEDQGQEPDWLAELAKNAEALRRQIDQGGEALQRQVKQLSRTAEELVRNARRATPGTGPVPRLLRVLDAAIQELAPPRQPVQHVMVFPATVTGQASFGVPTITVTGNAGELAVEEPRGSLLAGLSPGQILAIALIWVVAYALPIYLYSQSPTPSTLIEGNLATVALAYDITCRILDKRK
jgi:hypothetical protein